MARGKTRHNGKPNKLSACGAKAKFSEIDAKRKALERSRKTGGIYKAYKCQYRCKLENGARAWHIGHVYPSKH